MTYDNSHRGDSNPQPAVYKTAALPIELRWQDGSRQAGTARRSRPDRPRHPHGLRPNPLAGPWMRRRSRLSGSYPPVNEPARSAAHRPPNEPRSIHPTKPPPQHLTTLATNRDHRPPPGERRLTARRTPAHTGLDPPAPATTPTAHGVAAPNTTRCADSHTPPAPNRAPPAKGGDRHGVAKPTPTRGFARIARQGAATGVFVARKPRPAAAKRVIGRHRPRATPSVRAGSDDGRKLAGGTPFALGGLVMRPSQGGARKKPRHTVVSGAFFTALTS